MIDEKNTRGRIKTTWGNNREGKFLLRRDELSLLFG